MKVKLFLCALLVLSAFPVSAQKSVVPLPVDSAFHYGKNYLFYALPKTAFRVEVTVARVQEFQGPYSDYAGKLLGLTNVITQDKVVYSVKDFSMEQLSVMDTEYMYAVELSSKQVKDRMLENICLDNAIRAQGVESVSYVSSTPQIPDFFRYYSDLAYMEQSNNYVETQIVDGVVRQIPASHTKRVVKSSEQKAQEAADMIAKIREDRYALLTGSQETAYSSETVRLLVDELNQMEQNYLGLFIGFTVEDEQHFSFVYVPQANSNPALLCSVSSANGFSRNGSPNPSENYYLRIQPEEPVSLPQTFTAKWKCSKGYKTQNGYRVRTAVPAKVVLMRGAAEIFDFGCRDIYQWGHIEVLPVGMNDLDISKFAIIYTQY